MIATSSPRVTRWRSRQETEALRTPSSNHLIVTAPVKSTCLILVGGVIQAIRPASLAQKASGSWSAFAVIAVKRSASTSALAAIAGFTAISSSDMRDHSHCLLGAVPGVWPRRLALRQSGSKNRAAHGGRAALEQIHADHARSA